MNFHGDNLDMCKMHRAYKIFALYVTYTLVICGLKFAVKEFSPLVSIIMREAVKIYNEN